MKKQLYVGAESFEKIRSGDYFYVDKTLFIKELLDNKAEATLITRPRRFGKTLNMSMLGCFFDIRKDSKALFDGLSIMEHQDICEKHQNQYPVIPLTLKNVELNTYQKSIERIKTIVSSLCRQNRYLLDSEEIDEQQKDLFQAYLMKKSTEEELQYFLLYLTECLHIYHNKRVIVLIDEYDTPIDNSERNGYYDEMIEFMRSFLGSVFKTNEFLEFGVLTGVQRISKEGLLSSFNNPKVRGVLDNDFATSFGFTEDEIRAACELFEINDKFEDIKNWYDGYRFGGLEMYNPWSITTYLSTLELGNYWVNTGSVQILRDVFSKGDDRLRDDLASLLTGSPITMSLADQITYPIKYESTNTFWTLLLNAGYLKPCNGARDAKFEAELVNMEVKDTFSRYATDWLEEQPLSISDSIRIFVDQLLSGNRDGVAMTLNDDLLNNPSSFDLVKENSYHMFIYGMLLAVSSNYKVYSNQESGKGRADCIIKPKNKNAAAVIVEFKHLKDNQESELKDVALKGLEQINEKIYFHNLTQEGYTRIYKYSIAFHKKTCEVAMEIA